MEVEVEVEVLHLLVGEVADQGQEGVVVERRYLILVSNSFPISRVVSTYHQY